MRQWKLSEQNFENYTTRGRFQTKTRKLLTKFPDFATSGRYNSAVIAGNSLPNWPSTGCLVSVFTIRINSKSPLGCTGNVPTQIFCNVPCPIVRIKTNITLQCWCCLVTVIWKKSTLNWKLKISNAADNANITQWQARDTRHRRLQEVNSLCTDSGPL